MFFRRKIEKQELVSSKAVKTEFEKDLENLRQLEVQGKITQADLDYANALGLEELALRVSHWRHSQRYQDQVDFAYFALDEDLDKLVKSEYVGVRMGVAWRGRDKDLDKLVFDSSPDVRKVVAEQERPQDLNILMHDLDSDVRKTVAKNGSQKQLEKMVTDPDLGVRYILAYRGNAKVRRQLLHDEDENVRRYAKECLEFGGEEKD